MLRHLPSVLSLKPRPARQILSVLVRVTEVLEEAAEAGLEEILLQPVQKSAMLC